MSKNQSKDKDQSTLADNNQSMKGWNWGWYHMNKDKMDITHDKEGTKNAFSLKYNDIVISNATKENEIQLEFQHDNEGATKR